MVDAKEGETIEALIQRMKSVLPLDQDVYEEFKAELMKEEVKEGEFSSENFDQGKSLKINLK